MPVGSIELMVKLAGITGRPVEANHAAPRPGDVPHSQADISQARTRLGYDPRVDFEAGLERTVNWLSQGNHHQARPESDQVPGAYGAHIDEKLSMECE